MNPEPIDLLFRPEAPISSLEELDEIYPGSWDPWDICDRGEPVASITTGVNIVKLGGATVWVGVMGLRVGSDIHYLIQHEITGDALHEPTYRKSAAPLTLGEMYDFLMNAVCLFEGKNNMFEDVSRDPMDSRAGVENFLKFFKVGGGYYPDLDRLVRQRFIERWG